MHRPAYILILAMLATLAGTVLPAWSQPATIIYTTRADGRLENCRCPSDPHGALEKRLPEIERLRAMGPVLLIDAGDFLPPTMDGPGADAMLAAYELHQYDAIALGEHELKYGEEWIRRLDARLPIVSANLSYRDGTPVGQRVRFVERGDDAFAITGLIDRSTVRRLGPELYEQVSIADPEEALAAVIAEIPDEYRVIVLAHVPLDTIRTSTALFAGVDLVVGGHNSDLIDGAERLANTHLVQAGAKSRRIGLAEFRGSRLRAELRTIARTLPDDPRIVALHMDLLRQRAAGQSGE